MAEVEKRRTIHVLNEELDSDSLRQEISTEGYNDDVGALMNDMTFALGALLAQHYPKEESLKAIEKTIPNQLRVVVEAHEEGDDVDPDQG